MREVLAFIFALVFALGAAAATQTDPAIVSILSSIDASKITDGAKIAIVLDGAQIVYRYDATSFAVVDGVNVIMPTSGPGRWILAN
jgi:hypothetical protein